MSDETQSPFTSRGLRIHWGAIFKVVSWLVPLLLAACMLYLSSVFARHSDLEPYRSLPGRVEKLEEFKVEQKQAQNETGRAVGAVQQDLAGLKAQIEALKDESTRNTDRILQRLDTMRRD